MDTTTDASVATDPAEQFRTAVTAATIEVCRQRGYAGLSVDDVAERAGVERAAIDAVWPSKAALVITAFRNLIARDLVYAGTPDFRADLVEQLQGMARLFTSPTFGPFLAELIAEAQTEPATAEAFLRYVFGPNRKAAHERFRQAQEAGEVRADADLDVAVDLVFAPVWFRFLLHTGELTADYAVQVVDAALAGLRPQA